MTDSIAKRLFFHWYKYWHWYVFAFCIIIYLLVIVLTFNTGYSWDESIYLLHTNMFLGRSSSFNELGFRPVLLSILLMPFYEISSNLIFLRVLMIIFSILLIFALFLLLKKLFDFKISLLLVALFIISPVFIGVGQYVLTDLIVLLFVIPGMYFAYNYYYTEKKVSLMFASILFGFAFLTRFFYGSFLIFLILLILVKYRSIKIFLLELLTSVLPFFLVIFPYLLFSKYVFGGFFTTLRNGQILVSFYDAPWYNYFGYILAYWPLLFLFGCLGLYFLYKRRLDYKTKFYFMILLLSIIQFLYFCFTPHKESRYAIPLVFNLLFIAGFGLAHWFRTYSAKVKQKVLKILFFTMIIFGIFVIILFAIYYIPLEQKEVKNMLPINYLQDINEKGTIYVNTDVPQYIYLFPNNKVVNIYWYNLNDKNYDSLFTDNGVIVDNIWAKKLDLNFLNGHIRVLKEFSPYILYEVNVK